MSNTETRAATTAGASRGRKSDVTFSGRAPRESVAGRIVTMSILGVLTLYFLMPLYFLFVASTKPQGSLANSFGLWFADFDLGGNVSRLLERNHGIFGQWALNSLIYAGGGALVGTLISALAGYALAKFSFRGRNFLFSTILGGVMVPTTALALPLFLLFSAVHLTDTYWAVFLPSIVSPFSVYLARIFAAESVPDELIEAARLDGAKEFRIFFTVGFKLMSPALVTIFLFQFVAIWNNFFLPQVMLQSERLYPITLGLYNWNGQIARVPMLQESVLAGSLLSVVPLIVVFLLLQRFWRAGLGAGALK